MSHSLAKTSMRLVGACAFALLLAMVPHAAFAHHGGHYHSISSKSPSGGSGHKARLTTAHRSFKATPSANVRDHRHGAGWSNDPNVRDHRTITKLQQDFQHCILCL